MEFFPISVLDYIEQISSLVNFVWPQGRQDDVDIEAPSFDPDALIAPENVTVVVYYYDPLNELDSLSLSLQAYKVARSLYLRKKEASDRKEDSSKIKGNI